MSDLFQPGIPDEYAEAVSSVMVKADWHIYQVLTKRSDTLNALPNGRLRFAAERKAYLVGSKRRKSKVWPAANRGPAELGRGGALPIDRTVVRRLG